jgi:signal transduction histidine kinase
MIRLPFDHHSLTARLVLTLLAIAVGTILLIGIPTAWLARHQLEQQTWARLDQAVRVSNALFEAQRREAIALAVLTAQRPTLRGLIQQGDTASLGAYLEVLRAAAPAGLDAVVVSDPAGRLLGAATDPRPISQMAAEVLSRQAVPEQGALLALGEGQGLLIAAEAPILADASAERIGSVRLGFLLDEAFAAQLKEQTGLEHSLAAGSGCIVTTLGDCPDLQGLEDFRGLPPQRTFSAGGLAYYAAWLPLYGPEGTAIGGDEVALPASEFSAAAERIYAILLVSSLLFAALVALLGYGLARRVTRPVLRLAAASEAMGRGDLSTPLPFATRLTEVAVLGQTLEHMRRRLKAAYDELQRAKTWSENLISALTEGVVTVDDAGRITSFSPGAERILGWRSQEAIGRRYQAIFRPVEVGGPLPAPGALVRQHVLTRDGRPIVLAITGGAQMRRDDHGWEQAYVFRDVTAEEEALRLRESFLANVSHEFKTPLAALRAAIELLATEQPRLSTEELRELMDSILLGVLRLEELVDNLLSSASIQAGQFEVRPRPVDLGAIVEDVLLTTRPLLALRGQSLALDIPPDLPPVQADPRRLTQVLVNLISNASKYGPARRPIRLQAMWTRDTGPTVTVRVSDEGPGIPPEKRAQLFQPFRRPADESGQSGVGLGLSIVKTIVERHQGQVGVDSDERGTTFWFTLPLAHGDLEHSYARPGRR